MPFPWRKTCDVVGVVECFQVFDVKKILDAYSAIKRAEYLASIYNFLESETYLSSAKSLMNQLANDFPEHKEVIDEILDNINDAILAARSRDSTGVKFNVDTISKSLKKLLVDRVEYCLSRWCK